MVIEECSRYGFEFHILSKEKNSPAGLLTSYETVGDWNDEKCLKEFSHNCDIITLENEFIDFRKIRCIEDSETAIYPGSEILMLVQDKFYQKETLKKLGIPVTNFVPIDSMEDIIKFAEINKYPVILKSRTMGYDGKGNYEIKSEPEAKNGYETLRQRGNLMCERFVKFDKEIATQVARNKNGEIKIYPVVETIQKEHICNLVIFSKNMFENIKDKVHEIASEIVTNLNYIGVMGIEMFLNGEEILVNELAPRVHNSGHYTIEGCYTSQFENHVRSILNFPLGNTEAREENSVMINILGRRNGKARITGMKEILSCGNAFLHIYGKQETREGRKMGHITVNDKDLQRAIDTAKECRDKIEM